MIIIIFLKLFNKSKIDDHSQFIDIIIVNYTIIVYNKQYFLFYQTVVAPSED